VNKDRIFWGVWGAVVLGAGAWYVFVVSPLRADNAGIQEEKLALAVRFVLPDSMVSDEGVDPKAKKDPRVGKREQVKRLIGSKAQPADKLIADLYPLADSSNLRNIPSEEFVKVAADRVELLRETRSGMAEVLREASLEADDTARIFPEEGKIPVDPRLGRESIRRIDLQTDRMLVEAAPEMEVSFRESKAPLRDDPLQWLDDGRVSGYVKDSGVLDPEEMWKVLRRLALRRAVLMAVARARAQVPAIAAMGRGDVPVLQVRTVEKLVSLNFIDDPAEDAAVRALLGEMEKEREKKSGQDGAGAGRSKAGTFFPKTDPRPFLAHRFDLKVSCHPSVVPVLLQELGSMRQPGKARPLAFWATRVSVARPAGWPDLLAARAEVSAERLKNFGRYFEWPVTVHISGVVPEFNKRLDPEP
jgi:hypothetical protein